jgi:mono/diheme cytochrome c family protein
MLANSARDPYWLAALRAEVGARPDHSDEIQSECAACHMPMAHFTSVADGETPRVFDGGLLDPQNPLHDLAMDGVSCTLCHQIRETNLGLPESYSGGFAIDRELPEGQRLLFGPYSVEEDQADDMQAGSGYVPAQGLHLSTSELCATCHTLYLAPPGAQGGDPQLFPLQVTYFEWFYSSHRRSQTCQDCHMPEAEGGVRVASTSTNLRSPYAQHTFAGANAYLLRILGQFADVLGVPASAEQLMQAVDRSRENLLRAATIEVEESGRSGGRLTVELRVENLAGHKLPTGYPSRRVWIHLRVANAAGQVVFESGGWNPDGSIVGNDAETDPGSYEPHYLAVVSPDQVQIYEAVLQGSGGGLTTRLYDAIRYVKDNRLLPLGYQKAAPYPDLAVRGRALEDLDFDEGIDRIQYGIDVGSASGPFTVTVELLYQSVSPVWLAAMEGMPGDEIERFLGYTSTVDNTPELLAATEVEIP